MRESGGETESLKGIRASVAGIEPAQDIASRSDRAFHEADDVPDGGDVDGRTGLFLEVRPSSQKPEGSERTKPSLFRT